MLTMHFKKEKWLLLLLMFSFSICVSAQKKKVANDDEPPPLPPSAGKKTPAVKAPAKYEAIVEIDQYSNIRVTFEDPDFLDGYSDSTDWAENLFADLTKSSSTGNKNFSGIIVKPEPGLKFGEIVKVIQKLRGSLPQVRSKIPANRLIIEEPIFSGVRVQISKYFAANVPERPVKRQNNVKPNPLALLVEMNESGRLTLNSEETGTTADLAPLKSRLQEIFKERLENGAFAIGSNEVEATVFLRVPLSTPFAEIVRLAETLEQAGVKPLALQVDDLK